MFPALCVAFKRLSVLDRFADSQDKAVAALAVVTQFCLTAYIRTVFARVAHGLAAMWTLFKLGHAPLTTAVFHKVIDALKALAF